MNAAPGLADAPLVTYTIFPDVRPTKKTVHEDVPWRKFVSQIRNATTYPEKNKCPLISMADYGNAIAEPHRCLRYADNVQRVYGVEVDYDDEKVTIEGGAARFSQSNVCAVLYNSPSHTPMKPRWRALLPLSEPHAPNRRAEFVARANRILGGIASVESFTLSQSFYVGRVAGAVYNVIETTGRCIDHADEINPLFPVKHTEAGLGRDDTTDTELRKTFERREGRYQSMLKLASRWAARGMNVDDIESTLDHLLGADSVNSDGIDLRTFVKPLAKSAVRKYGETRAKSTAGVNFTGSAAKNDQQERQWPEPQSLDRVAAQSEPYPLDALPGLIGDAVREYQAYGQQPVALVASSALAVLSLATQGLADVARDERLIGPLSLNLLIIAESGERKTAADKTLGAVLGEWERERAEAMRDDIMRNRAEQDAWNAELEGFKTAIRGAIKSAKNKNSDELDELRHRLSEHALQKPVEVIAPRLRYEDVNPQSLASKLAAGHPSAALWSDEGGMVTGSLGMGKDSLLGFIAGLNRLWDGGEIHHDRKSAQSVHVEGRRLTVSLMLQPMVLRELAERGGGLTRGSGFLARYLVAAPLTTMGHRDYREPPLRIPYLAAFHRRIRELLDAPLPVDEQARLRPPVLRLAPSAFSVWRAYHDDVEHELIPLGEYATVRDFAAKSAENAARIAGCLHVFAGGQGSIDTETMKKAVTVARWYLREALRLLEVLNEPKGWVEAKLLDDWLAKTGDCPARDVLQSGPARLRDKGRRDAAIVVLTELGRARRESVGGREMMVRNPALKRSATATAATSATSRAAPPAEVANVAGVSVADTENQEMEWGEL